MNVDSNGNFFLSFLIAAIVAGAIIVGVFNTVKAAAVAILNVPVVVPCIGDISRTMIASTYTFIEYNALKIASVVGLSLRTPAWQPEKHGGIGYFKHYHTISVAYTIGKNGVQLESNPHSFFGTSVV